MTGSSPISAAKGQPAAIVPATTQTPKAIIPTEIKNESTLSMIGPFLQSANNRWRGIFRLQTGRSRIRTGRSLVPDLPLDKIAAQRGTRHTNSGYRFADSRHATVTERASGWRISSTCRCCPQSAHTTRPQLVHHEMGPFLLHVKDHA